MIDIFSAIAISEAAKYMLQGLNEDSKKEFMSYLKSECDVYSKNLEAVATCLSVSGVREALECRLKENKI